MTSDEIDRGNKLVTSFAELCTSERDRYLLQASQLIQAGTLEIFRSNCKFRYDISENSLSFHVDRLTNNTSVSGRLPMPIIEEEIVEKIVTAFAQSEALSLI